MPLQPDKETGTEPPPEGSLFRCDSPLAQVILIGLVCFCCPGMFNALSGMGGGGQVDPTAANNANTALYTFSVFGILGGGIYNVLCPKLTLLAGCSTYVLYAGSFLYYNHYHHQGFAVVSGALLGIGAGLLWASQGAIITSYPPPRSKRRLRGLIGVGVVAFFGTAVWAGGLKKQLEYSRLDLPTRKLDFKDGRDFAGPFVLYFGYGLLDAVFQSLVYWVIGALADDSEILSRYTGFYKGVQSAGAAVAWQIDAHKVSFLNQLITNWALMTVSYPLLALLIIRAIKDDDKAEVEPQDVGTTPGIH